MTDSKRLKAAKSARAKVTNEVFFNHRNNSDDIKITSAPSLFGIFPEVSSVTMPASLPPRLVKSARKEPPLRPLNFKERALMDLSKLNGICIAEEGYVLASVAVGV